MAGTAAVTAAIWAARSGSIVTLGVAWPVGPGVVKAEGVSPGGGVGPLSSVEPGVAVCSSAVGGARLEPGLPLGFGAIVTQPASARTRTVTEIARFTQRIVRPIR